MPELRLGGPRNFAVEHFRPKKIFPQLRSEYSNLYYACNTCNDFKGSHWPSPTDQDRGREFVDPCESAVSDHIAFDSTGTAEPRTRAGRYTIAHVNLDRELLKLWRTRKHQLEGQIAELEAIEAETDIPPGIRSVLERNRQRLQVDLQTEYAGWW
jgi:hypothetical protein